MSTDNAPETADSTETAHTPEIGTADEIETNNRSRAPPADPDPPRGASRSLGGTCPDCSGPMITRLRAEYGQSGNAQLRLDGCCDDCDLWLEGVAEQPFDMVPKEV